MDSLKTRKRRKKEKEVHPNTVKKRRYRENVRQDPVRHEKQKRKDRERKRQQRADIKRKSKACLEKVRRKKMLEMRKYRAKKKEREQQQMLPDEVRRKMAAKKREAAKKKAQQTKLMREKEKMTKEKKKKAAMRTKAWRLKIKINNSRPEQITQDSPHPPKENPFLSSSAEKRAVKRAKDALPNTPRRKKRVLEKLSSSSDPQYGQSTRSKKTLPFSEERPVIESLQEEICHLKPKGGSHTNNKVAYNALLNVASKIKVKYGLKGKLIKQLNIRRQKTKSRYWEVKARKPRKDKIPEDVKKEVKKFYLRGDISKELPSKKDVLKIKGKDGKVTIIQKHLMTITLQEAHTAFTRENPHVKIGFTSFRKLKPPQVKRVCETNRRSCLCKTCCNVALKVDALKKFTQKVQKQDKVPLYKSKREVSHATLCSHSDNATPKPKCLDRSCNKCGPKKVILQYTNGLKDVENEKISWYCWEYITIQKKGKDKRVTSCLAKETSLKTFLDMYTNDLKVLPSHLFRANWQHVQMSECKRNLKQHEMMMVMDYSENYSCRYQHEVQSAFFEPAQVTIHPMMVYYKNKINGKDAMVKNSIIGISDETKHDCHVVKLFEEHAINIAKKEIPSLKTVHQWTDGSACQYKGKTSFADISSKETGFTRNFFETSHGKSVCDGLGAIVKNACARAVLTEKAVISDAKSLFSYCKDNLEHDLKHSGEGEYSERHFVFVDKERVVRIRPEAEAKTLKGTQKLHAVKSIGEKGSLLVRKLSCYCEHCSNARSRLCINKQHVDDWSKKVLNWKLPIQDTQPSDDEDEMEEVIQDNIVQEENRDPRTNDFVSVYLTDDKGRKEEFVAQILEMDGDQQIVQLKFMKKEDVKGLFYWPTVDDISWECFYQILVILEEPVLCDSLSTKRHQLFSFSSKLLEKSSNIVKFL